VANIHYYFAMQCKFGGSMSRLFHWTGHLLHSHSLSTNHGLLHAVPKILSELLVLQKDARDNIILAVCMSTLMGQWNSCSIPWQFAVHFIDSLLQTFHMQAYYNVCQSHIFTARCTKILMVVAACWNRLWK